MAEFRRYDVLQKIRSQKTANLSNIENEIAQAGEPMKTYMCLICGYIYSEEKGDADHGLAPGTKWDDIPDNWQCPECGAMKDDFEMTEI